MSYVAGNTSLPREPFYVLGFDPGLSAAGFGAIDSVSLRCLRAWTVRTDTTAPIPSRMMSLADAIKAALDGISLLVIEDQHQTFFAKLAAGKSNPAAGRLAQVVGLAQGIAAERNIPCLLITPQTVRVRLGLSGSAKKPQVARTIRLQLAGIAPGVSAHALDGAAIALAGAREWHGRRILERKETA